MTPSAIHASSTNNAFTTNPIKAESHEGYHDKHKGFSVDLKEVEKYVPGAEEKVKQVLAERRELSKQLRELNARKLGVDISFMNDYKKVVQETHEKVRDGQMRKEDAEKYLKEQEERFEREHSAELAKLKLAKEKYADAHRDEINSKKEAKKQDIKKIKEAKEVLEEAVKSQDGNKVKVAYNNYLHALKTSNQLLRNEISKLN